MDALGDKRVSDMRAINYQVQEKLKDGRWGWFSDFETRQQARHMMEVYKEFYPSKDFRIEEQFDSDVFPI